MRDAWALLVLGAALFFTRRKGSFGPAPASTPLSPNES